MSKFAVRIIGPSGRITYLSNGREVELQRDAAVFKFADDAWQAGNQYVNRIRALWPNPPMADVVDLND